VGDRRGPRTKAETGTLAGHAPGGRWARLAIPIVGLAWLVTLLTLPQGGFWIVTML